MNSDSEPLNEEREDSKEPVDPFATILFVVFGVSLGYLVIARAYGFYPWMVLVDLIIFVPSWDAILTFVIILVLGFVTLIGGLMRMRYSKFLVGIITLVAVFVITFYSLYLVAWLTSLPLP